MIKNIAIIIIIIITIIIIFYLPNNIKCINSIKYDDELERIEKKFNKKYPIGNNFFTIKHYPRYHSFFNQFLSYKYYIYKENNKIIGTCCFAKLYVLDCYYICDLKSFVKGKNLTYYFFKKFIINNIIHFNFSGMFGITMQPNLIVDKLVKKYYFSTYEILYLYEIKYEILLKNIKIFIDYFGNDFGITYGNKILNIYDKNDKFIETKKLIHIKRHNLDNFINNEIKLNDLIMFCVPSKNKFNIILKKNNIHFINKMNIFGIGLSKNINWKFIETYMI